MYYVNKDSGVVNAIQFNGFDKQTGHVQVSEHPEWLVNEFGKTVIFFDKPDTLTIKTIYGKYLVQIGDYIVKGANGGLYHASKEFFERTFTEVKP